MTDKAHASPAHVWRFFRAGGFDQVRLDRSEDIASVRALDQKLWVALACPTRGIEFDERTLDLIDTDRDGRIRAPEIIAAVDWTVGLVKDPDELLGGRAMLPLAAIDDRTDEGCGILATARAMLRILGRDESADITLQDTVEIEAIYNATAFNGDGVVPVDTAEDDETKGVIADIIDCIGPQADRSGKPGVSQETSNRFFAEAAALVAWRAEPAAAVALGDGSDEAGQAVGAVADKLDDYFTRCKLARYDPRAGDALNAPISAYEAIAAAPLSPDRAEIAALPIARVEPDRPLPLADGINPAWAHAIGRLRASVVVPLVGERSELSEAEWRGIKSRFADHSAWLARKPVTAVEKLGFERLRRLVASDARRKIDDLIARDKALAPEMKALAEVEKLIRMRRDLWPLLNNFVSFRDFYTRRGKASFQAGTLFLDGRSCELCVRVDDENKHAQLATLSRIYLAYCRCTRRGEADTMTIAAAFTAGDATNLRIGRNGVFYDRKGRDWDATIVKIVEHPISIGQAFWMPYRQAARVIGEQVQKFAAARAASAQTQMVVRATQAAAAPAPAEAAPRDQSFDAARFAGIFAAIGLALGAIGTAVASVVTGFLQLSWWQMPIAVAGLVLAVSGPSVLIASLKLKDRNLGPILDACGWAVNARLRINIAFGNALTSVARLPEGAERSLHDPYADKRRPYELWVLAAVAVLAVAALWRYGVFAAWLKR